MHAGVDEHECATSVGVDFDGELELIHSVAAGVVAGEWVRKIRLVAAGHDHRGAISGTDVGERYEQVELAASELSVAHRELCPNGCIVATRMPGMMATSLADGRDVLVDGDPLHVCACLAGIPAGMVDPRWMIDQQVERRVAAVEHVVEFEARVSGVVAALRIAHHSPWPSSEKRSCAALSAETSSLDRALRMTRNPCRSNS